MGRTVALCRTDPTTRARAIVNAAERIAVYIDFKSPYSYVAVRPLIELAQSEGITIDWLPYCLKLNAAEPGAQPKAIYSMRKIRYLYMDVRRFATPQGLVIKGPERLFDGTVSSIGMLFAQKHGLFEAYRDRVFERFFKRELDIDSETAIAAVLGELGADEREFGQYLAAEGARLLEEIIRDAEALGVFGVPTMVYRTELFWGGDRIDMLRMRLRENRLKSSVT